MIYLETNSTDPYYNLAFEEFVFNRMDRSEQYFILWQNYNTIVVGRFQNTAEEINAKFVQEHNIQVARRLSGGGAVYHDAGNLNFTFIVDQNSHPDFDFKVFVEPVIQTLAELGVRAELSGRNDLTIDGQKFSGNSQYIRSGRILHHGCIMLDSNLANVAQALRVREAKFSSKSVKSVRSRVTTINQHTASPVDIATFKASLIRHSLRSGNLQPGSLTSAQLAEVQRLRDEKYATWEWNYGNSPSYEMRREKKFEAGLVTVLLRATGEWIDNIKFYGDFFGNGDLSDLEQSLVGAALTPELERRLETLNLGWYMQGISAKELTELLLY